MQKQKVEMGILQKKQWNIDSTIFLQVKKSLKQGIWSIQKASKGQMMTKIWLIILQPLPELLIIAKYYTQECFIKLTPSTYLHS